VDLLVERCGLGKTNKGPLRGCRKRNRGTWDYRFGSAVMSGERGYGPVTGRGEKLDEGNAGNWGTAKG